MALTPCQLDAMAAVRRRARDGASGLGLTELAVRAFGSSEALGAFQSALWRRARVALHFHPDRLLADRESVAEGLSRTGRYRSQFETGISNGSRSAFPGGDRHRWEAQLFETAYSEAAAAERPKYGALHALGHSDGPSPRFGSCYLVLRPEVSTRCTFTWGDSHVGPERVGTLDAFEGVLAAWIEAVLERGEALGVRGELVGLLDRPLESTVPGRALDDYIEAQVHGDVELATDVERLVIDPSFVATETGATMRDLGRRWGFEVRAHPGFVLDPRLVPDDFRGPRMPALAARVAEGWAPGGTIDAAAIGRASRSYELAPESWRDWIESDADDVRQQLKQLWHVLVQFGAPSRDACT